jgi:hypothetical protein
MTHARTLTHTHEGRQHRLACALAHASLRMQNAAAEAKLEKLKEEAVVFKKVTLIYIFFIVDHIDY